MPETCRDFYKIKFGKFVRLFGFIKKQFVTMHGHMNVMFFSASLLIAFLSPEIATFVNIHVPFSLPLIMMSGLLLGLFC